MADTSISSEWGLKAGLSWFANALHAALLAQAHVKISIASMVDRTPIRIMPLNVLAPLGRLRVGSACESSDLMNVFCTVVFAISIINVNLSLALAETEETIGQIGSVSDYSQYSFSLGLTDSLNGGEFTKNLYDNDPMGNVEVGSSLNLGDVFIPTTVWSLDVSSGAHLEHISSEASTDLGALLGSHRRYASPNFIRGFWTNKNSNRPSSSLRLQVANCGGVSRERSNLDFCNFDDKSTKHDGGSDKEAIPDSGNGSINATNNSSDATIASESQSTLSQETQPVVEPGVSSPMPAGQVHARHRRHAVQTAPTDDPTASVDDPTTPVVDPMDPIVYLEPPDSPPSVPVFPIGGPAPPSDPLPILTLTPAPIIPETSTEVMMMIGFSIMFLKMRGNSNNSLPRRVARAFYKINKRYLHNYSS
jgi:hypothetical protein